MRKSQLIYQYIREQGAVSKQDIVIGLGLSLPTITQNLNNLAELGLIDTSKKISNTGGRNATAYSYIEKARYAVGLYLNRHHINCVAVDLSGNVISLIRVRENFDLNDDNYLRKIGETVEEVKKDTGLSDDRFLGVGIAVQGLISDDGERVTYGLTLNFTGVTRADIAKYIPYHNRLFHDSAAAGYAEVWDRNDLDDAFYLSLSNSVGAVSYTHLSSIGRHRCLEVARMWGNVVFLGEQGTVTFEPSPLLLHKNLTLHGSWVTSVGNMERLVEFRCV